MEIRLAIAEFLAEKKLSTTKSTQKWYGGLYHWCDHCESLGLTLQDLKTAHVNDYLAMIAERPHHRTGKPLADLTVHGHAQQIRTFLRWCMAQDDDDFAVSKRTRVTMPKVEQHIVETLSDEHINKLFAACESERDTWGNDVLVIRDRAILAVLLDTGIRASELCDLSLDHCYLDPDDSHLKVMGKGRKEREVGPLGKQCRAFLRRYITRYRKAPKSERHVFLSRTHEPMTVSGLEGIIRRLVKAAHITDINVHPHVFRHTYAVRFLKQTGDMYRLSRLMGHTSIAVTERYVASLSQKDVRTSSTSILDDLK